METRLGMTHGGKGFWAGAEAAGGMGVGVRVLGSWLHSECIETKIGCMLVAISSTPRTVLLLLLLLL